MPALALSLTETLSGKPRVSYDEFLALTDSMHVEWVDGEVVQMMAIGYPHNRVSRSGIVLLEAFLDIHPVGELFYEPMQMKTGPSFFNYHSATGMLDLSHRVDRNITVGRFLEVIEEYVGDLENSKSVWAPLQDVDKR